MRLWSKFGEPSLIPWTIIPGTSLESKCCGWSITTQLRVTSARPRPQDLIGSPIFPDTVMISISRQSSSYHMRQCNKLVGYWVVDYVSRLAVSLAPGSKVCGTKIYAISLMGNWEQSIYGIYLSVGLTRYLQEIVVSPWEARFVSNRSSRPPSCVDGNVVTVNHLPTVFIGMLGPS